MKKKKGFKIAYVFEFVAFAGIVFSAAIFALMFFNAGVDHVERYDGGGSRSEF